jgi:hypothetical protein
MFSLYYAVKNIIDEIKSENRYDRVIAKLYKQNNKLKVCIQQYTYKFYGQKHLYSRYILLNHIFEIEFIVRENVDAFHSHDTGEYDINLLLLKTKDKIKELKREMHAM